MIEHWLGLGALGKAAVLVYLAVAAGLCCLGLHRLSLAAAARRSWRSRPAPPSLDGELPVVTVQLPLYNERNVVERLIRAAGAEVRYLPAYSPDLNPIEKAFSKLKAYLRSAAVRTVDGLIEAMGDALRAIRPGDILAWFRHSGYGPPRSSDTVNKKPL